MTFENGKTISVQWGFGNYCENHDSRDAETYNKHGVSIMLECPTAEVATWDKNGIWNLKEYFPDACDDVKGWLNANEVLDLMNKVASK